MKAQRQDEDQIELTVHSMEFEAESILSKFIVESYHLTNYDDSTIHLRLELHRLSGPFWMSLFIPSICLVLAAEVALFIDKSQFQATIMISLTSNLVMYTLYSGIQEKLPEDSRYKLIDYWLLHGLVMPMIVFIVLATNEMVNSRLSKVVAYSKGVKVANDKDKTQMKDGGNSIREKIKYCLQLCKFIVPVISFTFMVTFFAFICQDR